MAEARSLRARRAALGVRGTWRRLNFEQRVAAVGALLLVVSTFGPFSFVEAAEVLVGLGVLVLLRQRAERRRFHLPFGDGTVILGAALWAALLIVIRLFDRPLGQNLLALACAGILGLAGAAERHKRPPDDLPPEEKPTRPIPPSEAATERMPDEPG
jgi:drug/metabolite transporter (DMT)-like permease